MPDLIVQIKADLTNYIAGMKQAGTISASAASDITKQLAQASQATENLGGSALSASMRLMQMRSGMSAARDGVIGFTMSGQRAESALMAMGHHFTSLINETGSLGGAFRALGSSLLGTGGIILAVTLAAELWRKYSKEQSDAYDATKHFTDAVKAQDSIFNNLDSSYKDAVKNVDELRINVDLAKKGFIDKNEVIKEYNNTIGKTTGQVKTLDGVEQSLVKNGDAYIKMMLYKAAAQTALSQAADKAVEIAKKQAMPDSEALGWMYNTTHNVINADELKRIAQFHRDEASKEYQKDEDLLTKAAKSLQDKAAAIAKEMHFNFLVSDDKKTPKTDAEKKYEEARKAALKIQQEYDNKQLEASLTGEKLELQVLEDKYNKDLAIEKKGGADTTSLTKFYNDSKIAIQKKYADQRAEIAKKIDDEIAGIDQPSRKKDLADNQKWYDEKLIQIKNFGADYLREKAILDAALVNKNKETNAKYDNKDYSDEFDNKLKEFNAGSKNRNILGIDYKKENAELLANLEVRKKEILKNNVDVQKLLTASLLDYEKKVENNNALEQKQKNAIVLAHELSGAFDGAFNSIVSGSQNAMQAVVQALEQMIVKLVEAIVEAAILASLLAVFTGGFSSIGSAFAGGFSGTAAGSFGSFVTQGTGLHLAEGGITSGPTRALIGEGREREAVMPLSKLQNFINTNKQPSHSNGLVATITGSNLQLWDVRSKIQKGRVG